jgi:hypothetical protein
MVHQKLITMNKIHNRPVFHHRLHLYILRRLVILANMLGLAVYIFLRIIFYDLPFVLEEELFITLNILGWATGIAVAISFILFVGHAFAYLIRYRKQLGFTRIMQVAEPATNTNRIA